MPPTIDRNPDVTLSGNPNLDKDLIPPGHYIHEGKNLMQSARFAKIPFGVARRREPCGNSTRLETVGIVIRDEHRERFTAAMVKKEKRKALYA